MPLVAFCATVDPKKYILAKRRQLAPLPLRHCRSQSWALSSLHSAIPLGAGCANAGGRVAAAATASDENAAMNNRLHDDFPAM
jgi:hypothetical protein